MRIGNFGALWMAFMHGIEAYLDVNSGKVIRVFRDHGEISQTVPPNMTDDTLKGNPDRYVCLPHVCGSEIRREFLLFLHLSTEKLNKYKISLNKKYDLFLLGNQIEDGRFCVDADELLRDLNLLDVFLQYQSMECSALIFQWGTENDIKILRDFYEYDENGEYIVYESMNDYFAKHKDE